MEIVALSDISEDTWAQFVDACEECWLYHHPLFLDLEANESRSFAVLDNGAIVGGCVLYVTGSGLGRVLCGRYGPAGLALLPHAHRRAYSVIKEHLIDTARRDKCHAVQMLLPALAPAYGNAEYLRTHLYHLGFSDSLRWGTLALYTPSYTTIIDLHKHEEEIFVGFAKSVREKCRLAQRVPFTAEFCEKAADAPAWEAFLRNHGFTMHRGNATPLNNQLMQRLRKLMDNGFAALVSLKVGGETRASLLLLTYKNAAYYFASGVLPAAYDDGFAAQLHWTAIQELKKRGFAKYEIGQFYPALRGTKLKDIGEFKRRFGGQPTRVLCGEFVTCGWRWFWLDVVPGHARSWLRSKRDSWRRARQ